MNTIASALPLTSNITNDAKPVSIDLTEFFAKIYKKTEESRKANSLNKSDDIAVAFKSAATNLTSKVVDELKLGAVLTAAEISNGLKNKSDFLKNEAKKWSSTSNLESDVGKVVAGLAGWLVRFLAKWLKRIGYVLTIPLKWSLDQLKGSEPATLVAKSQADIDAEKLAALTASKQNASATQSASNGSDSNAASPVGNSNSNTQGDDDISATGLEKNSSNEDDTTEAAKDIAVDSLAAANNMKKSKVSTDVVERMAKGLMSNITSEITGLSLDGSNSIEVQMLNSYRRNWIDLAAQNTTLKESIEKNINDCLKNCNNKVSFSVIEQTLADNDSPKANLLIGQERHKEHLMNIELLNANLAKMAEIKDSSHSLFEEVMDPTQGASDKAMTLSDVDLDSVHAIYSQLTTLFAQTNSLDMIKDTVFSSPSDRITNRTTSQNELQDSVIGSHASLVEDSSVTGEVEEVMVASESEQSIHNNLAFVTMDEGSDQNLGGSDAPLNVLRPKA